MPNETINQAAEIRELKEDMRELSNLVALLAGFVKMPPEDEKAAIEFEARLSFLLDKQKVTRRTTPHEPSMEGNILLQPLAKDKGAD